MKHLKPKIQEDRKQAWDRLTLGDGHGPPPWDMLVIGGGIVGAGILREAARQGWKAALIEQRDFSWGTSSRSSKMVHGGLRYLMAGQVNLARDSIREREGLLKAASGLVNPMGFLFGDYRGRMPGRWSFGLLLTLYDLIAGRKTHGYYPAHEFALMAPHIRTTGLKGGARSHDAVTDDARLVYRLIQEARMDGALALNYLSAESLLTQGKKVCGVSVRDHVSGSTAEVTAKVVVNATGAWVDRLRKEAGGGRVIRPLRGSHLVFPFWRLPVAQTVTLMHPRDRRPVFVMPWEGAVIVGNTDRDHTKDLDEEAAITPHEVDYLLEMVRYQFPALDIDGSHIQSTYSGVRPVIGRGGIRPSKERRDHRIWVERGLISVSGGKLTTFRLIARDILRRAAELFPFMETKEKKGPLFRQAYHRDSRLMGLDPLLAKRLMGRYGPLAREIPEIEGKKGLIRVPGTDTLWAELRWAARAEGVVHLDDLLLRRTRLGILLEKGGEAFMDRIQAVCREELGWSDAHWEQERKSYQTLWRTCYSVPI